VAAPSVVFVLVLEFDNKMQIVSDDSRISGERRICLVLDPVVENQLFLSLVVDFLVVSVRNDRGLVAVFAKERYIIDQRPAAFDGGDFLPRPLSPFLRLAAMASLTLYGAQPTFVRLPSVALEITRLSVLQLGSFSLLQCLHASFLHDSISTGS
jgi:hypothetical protein